MLSGMVQAYNVLGDAEALQAVRDTITFLQGHMLRDGRLLSVYKDGQAKLNGYLDDYAFLAAALLDAFEATLTPAYFDLAEQLINTMLEEFWDEEHWAFFSLARVTKRLSSAPNRCMTRLSPQAHRWPPRRSLRLYHYTGKADYLQRAEQVLYLVRQHMEQQPFGVGSLLTTLDFYVRKPTGNRPHWRTQIPRIPRPCLRALHQQYSPNKVLFQLDPQHVTAALEALPLLRDVLAGKAQVDGKATVYVCHNFTCSLPVTDPEALSNPIGTTSERYVLTALVALVHANKRVLSHGTHCRHDYGEAPYPGQVKNATLPPIDAVASSGSMVAPSCATRLRRCERSPLPDRPLPIRRLRRGLLCRGRTRFYPHCAARDWPRGAPDPQPGVFLEPGVRRGPWPLIAILQPCRRTACSRPSHC